MTAKTRLIEGRLELRGLSRSGSRPGVAAAAAVVESASGDC
jgi:hypothetical protein